MSRAGNFRDSVRIIVKTKRKKMMVIEPSAYNPLVPKGRCIQRPLHVTFVEVPNVCWNDVGGLEDVKKELTYLIERPAKCPELFFNNGLSPLPGAFLFGPPGCGKTLLANAIANEFQVNFIFIKGTKLMGSSIEESLCHVRDVFAEARAASPCVIFFDDFHSIVNPGNDENANSSGHCVVKEIFHEIDEMIKTNEKDFVFVLGATNKPDLLDPVLSYSKIDKFIYIPFPDEKAREDILKVGLRTSCLAKDVDFSYLAKITQGCSGADLSRFCKRAHQLAVHLFNEAKLQCERLEAVYHHMRTKVVEKDPFARITREHFVEAEKLTSRSVTGNQILVNEAFAQSKGYPNIKKLNPKAVKRRNWK